MKLKPRDLLSLARKVFSIVLVIVITFSLTSTAFAAGAFGEIEEFKEIDGDGRYINVKDRYYLDIVDPGMFHQDITWSNRAANGIFRAATTIVELTCVVFYRVTTLNFAEVFDLQLTEVQKSLKEQLFDMMFPLAFSFAALGLAALVLRRNYPEILSQVTKIFVVCLAAVVLSQYSSQAFTSLDKVTSEVSSSVMSAMSLQESSGASYSVSTASALWASLIHEPWKTLEFDQYKPDKAEEERIIENLFDDSMKPLSEPRQEFIDNTHKDHEEAFGLELSDFRLGFMGLYFILLCAKCFIYMVIAILQAAFRIITLLLIIMGVFVLLASIFPKLGGTGLIEKWLLKILEMQIMIIVLTFMMGFFVFIDKALYNFANTWGWFVVLFLQVAFTVILFVFRKNIFGLFGTIHKKVGGQLQLASERNKAKSDVHYYHHHMKENQVRESQESQGFSSHNTMSNFTGSGGNSSYDGNGGGTRASLPTNDSNYGNYSAKEPVQRPTLKDIQPPTNRSWADPQVVDDASVQQPDLNMSEEAQQRQSQAYVQSAYSEQSSPISSDISNRERSGSPIFLYNSDEPTQTEPERPTLATAASAWQEERGEPASNASAEVLRPNLSIAPEKSPETHVKNEATRNIDKSVDRQSERPVAAQAFNFDMGSFEQHEVPRESQTTIVRPTLKT